MGDKSSKMLDRKQAEETTAKIANEVVPVVENWARFFDSFEPSTAATIRAAQPECVGKVLEWALPAIRKGASITGTRVDFSNGAVDLISKLTYLFAFVLLRNVQGIEWRVGDDPDHPQTYVYQNHAVLGREGGREEVDPFVVVANVIKRIIREDETPREILAAYKIWANKFGKSRG